MAKRAATDVFHDWALNGKDEGMERGHAFAVNQMLSFIFEKTEQMQRNFSAVDVGCGNGWVVRLLNEHQRCEYAEGIDGAAAMIEKAKNIDQNGNYFLCKLPEYQSSRKFDVIHSMEFLYYLKNPQNMLKVFCEQWLNSGGWAVIGVDHYLEHKASLDWPEHVGVEMTTLSIDQWLEAWKGAGFTNIKHWQAGRENPVTLIIAGQKPS